jgi:hypothetical protein
MSDSAVIGLPRHRFIPYGTAWGTVVGVLVGLVVMPGHVAIDVDVVMYQAYSVQPTAGVFFNSRTHETFVIGDVANYGDQTPYWSGDGVIEGVLVGLIFIVIVVAGVFIGAFFSKED